MLYPEFQISIYIFKIKKNFPGCTAFYLCCASFSTLRWTFQATTRWKSKFFIWVVCDSCQSNQLYVRYVRSKSMEKNWNAIANNETIDMVDINKQWDLYIQCIGREKRTQSWTNRLCNPIVYTVQCTRYTCLYILHKYDVRYESKIINLFS